MQILEPPKEQGQYQKDEQHQHSRQLLFTLSSMLIKTIKQALAEFAVLLLSIAGITIVFAVSLGLDFVIILILNGLFGTAFGANNIARIIFSGVQYISYLGAGISYFLMIFLLLGLYTLGSLNQSWRATRKNTSLLKTKMYQLLQDTIMVLIDALRLFSYLVTLIIAIALALFLVSQALPPATFFLEAVKICTAFAIVIAYIVNVAPPLWQYGKDIFHKLFEKSDE